MPTSPNASTNSLILVQFCGCTRPSNDLCWPVTSAIACADCLRMLSTFSYSSSIDSPVALISRSSVAAPSQLASSSQWCVSNRRRALWVSSS
ncbi:hypothetical protein D3C81_1074810 [compost metagenome]